MVLYQTMACRYYGRSAFYQAGGAYGFRDQLQDVMAIVYTCPEIARQHILLSASRQFVQGDVQHWWHPPSGKGLELFSDDFLFLPYVLVSLCESDWRSFSIGCRRAFLESIPLADHEHERYEHRG